MNGWLINSIKFAIFFGVNLFFISISKIAFYVFLTVLFYVVVFVKLFLWSWLILSVEVFPPDFNSSVLLPKSCIWLIVVRFQ